MAYDVFLAYAREDRDMAALVARRLRALKFKVRFNRKGEDAVFDDKDARDALRSKTMLVLWSEAALTSDWVRAAASVGHSREDCLLEAGLDETIPYEPFRLHTRYDLQGFTSRTTVEGWYETVEALSLRHNRKHLREWISIGSKDEDAKTAWLDRHPDDPLALHAKAQRDKKLGITPTKKAASPETATLAASAIGTKKPAAEGTSAQKASTLGQDAVMVPLMLGCIGLLFVISYFVRSEPLPNSPICYCETPDPLPPVSTGSGILEPGPIINDTEPEDE